MTLQQNNWVVTDTKSTLNIDRTIPFFPITKAIFESCPFKDFIFQKQEVMFIISVGSSATKLTDNYSDWDLHVFINNKVQNDFDEPQEYYMSYNNKLMHWYYKTLPGLLNQDNFLQICGIAQLGLITEENLLYLNPKYQAAWNKFYENRNIISKFGIWQALLQARSYVLNFFKILDNNQDLKTIKANGSHHIPLKFLHKICVWYFIAADKNYLKHKDWLMRVKRIRYNDLTQKDLLKLQKVLKDFLNLANSKNLAAYEAIEEWIRLWNN